MDEFEVGTGRMSDDLQELLARRERIEDWLDRLSRETTTNERVVARVRSDYLTQLRDVLDEMTQHRDAIRFRAAEVRAEVQSTTEAAEAAREELEEAELRHRIGELDPNEWDVRRAQLESRAGSVEKRVDALRGELDELDRILQAIDSETGDDGDSAELTLEAPPAAGDPDQARPMVDDAPSEPVSRADDSGEVPSVVRDLDRDDDLDDEDDFLATRPGPGVKCPRCGYKNDVGAIYCGVCGVQLT